MNALIATLLLLAETNLAAPLASSTATVQSPVLDLSPRPDANVTAHLPAPHKVTDRPYYNYLYSFEVLAQQQCYGPDLKTTFWFSPVSDKREDYIDYPFPNPINVHANKPGHVNIQGWNLWASITDDIVNCECSSLHGG